MIALIALIAKMIRVEMIVGAKIIRLRLVELRIPFQTEKGHHADAMGDPKFKTEYGLSRLIRYSGKRQTFFENMHRYSLFINAVAGSSAFVTLLAGAPQLAIWLTAAVAIVSSLDNIVGFSERARTYGEQRGRYYDLYCEVVGKKSEGFDEDRYRQKRLRIDGDGPPRRRVLDVVCRNEEDIFRGFEYQDTVHIHWFRKALRHFIDLPPSNWVTHREREEKKNNSAAGYQR